MDPPGCFWGPTSQVLEPIQEDVELDELVVIP